MAATARGRRHSAIRLTTDKLRARPGFYGAKRLRYVGVSRGGLGSLGGFRMKKYSIVRVGDEYVVRAGDTSILKVSSQQEAAGLVTDAAELLQQQPDPAAEEGPSTSEQLRDST